MHRSWSATRAALVAASVNSPEGVTIAHNPPRFRRNALIRTLGNRSRLRGNGFSRSRIVLENELCRRHDLGAARSDVSTALTKSRHP
jgi:hypothetical protein